MSNGDTLLGGRRGFNKRWGGDSIIEDDADGADRQTIFSGTRHDAVLASAGDDILDGGIMVQALNGLFLDFESGPSKGQYDHLVCLPVLRQGLKLDEIHGRIALRAWELARAEERRRKA